MCLYFKITLYVIPCIMSVPGIIKYACVRLLWTHYGQLVDDCTKSVVVCSLLLPSQWVSIDDTIIHQKLIEIWIDHAIVIIPYQINQRVNLIHTILCAHPVTHNICGLGPFSALPIRLANLYNRVFFTILALPYVTINWDLGGDIRLQ